MPAVQPLHPAGGSVMAGDPPPPRRSSFASGLLVGCCVPPAAMFVLFLLFLLFSGPTFTVKSTEALTPATLPRVEPGTPAAGLLPAAPKAERAPVYVGDDLACVPELALEDTPAAPP